jgi:hypothetical protein
VQAGVAVAQGDAPAASGACDADANQTNVPNATKSALRIRRRYQIEYAARCELIVS